MTAPLRPTYEPTSNTFFDGTANYVVSGFWEFTGGTSADFDPTANFTTTGNWTNSGTWAFSNASFTLSGLASATTSNILYIDSNGLITKGAVPSVTGVWLTAGNALSGAGFLGSTNTQSLNIGTNSVDVISIDGTTQALAFPALTEATTANVLYYDTVTGNVTYDAAPTPSGVWLTSGQALSGIPKFGSTNANAGGIEFIWNNIVWMSVSNNGSGQPAIDIQGAELEIDNITSVSGTGTPPTSSPPSGYSYLIINNSGIVNKFLT